jgi:hypothetical protein
MRRALLPLLLLAHGSLFALEFFPPAPDSHTGVRIEFLAVNCAPVVHVVVSGSTITLTSTPSPGIICIAALIPLPAVADVGVLQPGVYDVQGEAQEHGKLIVRDAGAGIVVSPVGLSTIITPKVIRTVQVFSDRPLTSPLSVLFDGIPATIEATKTKSRTQYVVVTPPPHDAGTVDVTLTDGEGSRKAIAAFTYFDPAAPPDPAVLEPVLYPVAYNGPGVFDSRWRTENGIGTGADTVIRFRDVEKVEACNGACGSLNWSALLSRQSQAGALIWMVRRRIPLGVDVDDQLRLSSRIIEFSRPDDVNTTLPVAREGDFKQSFVIERVPLGVEGRVTLRIYALANAHQAAVVMADVGGTVTPHVVDLTPNNGVAFGTLELAPSALNPRTAPLTLTVIGTERVWGLATITDNITQRVTAFWPQ